MNRVVAWCLLSVVCGSVLGCGGDAATAPKPSVNSTPGSDEQGSGTKDTGKSDTKPSGSGSRP